MAGFVPLPETVIHSRTRLTHREAHQMLSSFLDVAETNPAYRTDAVLTQHGPQASGVGAGSNLTLTQLKRILDGIEGKRIGRLDFEQGENGSSKRRKFDGDTEFTSSPPVVGREGQQERAKRVPNQENVVEMADGDADGEAALVAEETDGWQDKEEFELAQVDETEDIGDRDPAHPGDGTDGQVDEADFGLQTASATTTSLSKSEKDARKKAKKERKKQERRENEGKTRKVKQ